MQAWLFDRAVSSAAFTTAFCLNQADFGSSIWRVFQARGFKLRSHPVEEVMTRAGGSLVHAAILHVWHRHSQEMHNTLRRAEKESRELQTLERFCRFRHRHYRRSRGLFAIMLHASSGDCAGCGLRSLAGAGLLLQAPLHFAVSCCVKTTLCSELPRELPQRDACHCATSSSYFPKRTITNTNSDRDDNMCVFTSF